MTAAPAPALRPTLREISRREVGRVTRLALPIVGTNLAWMSLGVVDTVMLGRWSKESLAASAVANVWISLTQIVCMGLLMGMDPTVTQAHGARDRRRMALALQRGLVLAALLSPIIVGARFFTEEMLGAFRRGAVALAGDGSALGLDAAVEREAETYAIAQTWAAPFLLVYYALRQQLQGRGIVRPTLVVTTVAVLFNVVANGVLIFGCELGSTGAGIATGLTRVALCLGLVLVVKRGRLLRGAWIPWSRDALRGLGEPLRYGIPIAVHFAVEMGAFGISTLLAGLLGVIATSAHTIVVNMASLTFMVPLGVSIAGATRVGNLIGRGSPREARVSAWVSISLCVATMAAFGVVLALGRNALPLLYTDEAAVIALAATILPVAAAFQVVDGLQVACGGVLRGMGHTVPAAAANIVAWYGLGLPLAWVWTIEREGGLVAIWWSLAAGLGVLAVILAVWLSRMKLDAFEPRALERI